MSAFVPLPDYLLLTEACTQLSRHMHGGMSPSEQTKQLQQKGVNILDSTQTMAAAVQALREAILFGELGLYVELPSWKQYRQLSDEVCHAAIRPRGGVLTLAYLARHPMAPFGLRGTVLQELMQASPLVKRRDFDTWLTKEERKKAWPCHSAPFPKPRRGRPPLFDKVPEIIEQLKESGQLHMKCECRSSLKLEAIHNLVLKQAPHLSKPKAEIIETVRRALQELELLSARSTRILSKWSNGHCSGCKWRTSIR